jgi:AcrR family transcriptional regulator
MKSAGYLLHPQHEVPSRHEVPGRDERESLRERKKRLTREAVYAAASRLFAARGYDAVTVAEIADAANISVKTLFTYITAKEDLLFGGQPSVLDAIVAAVAGRRLGQTPLVAAGQALLRAVDAADDPGGLDAFLRLAGGGPAARSRLRALCDEAEDALTETLAAAKDGPRELAARRLTAAQIMVLVRAAASDQVSDLIAKSADTENARREALKDWLRDAAGQLARGLQAAGR